VAFDPLDGSSIVGANFSVGSIFGIWPGTGLVGRTGRQQAAAAYAVYGPRTLLVWARPEAGELQVDCRSACLGLNIRGLPPKPNPSPKLILQNLVLPQTPSWPWKDLRNRVLRVRRTQRSMISLQLVVDYRKCNQ
jgi:hypothetical protein